MKKIQNHTFANFHRNPVFHFLIFIMDEKILSDTGLIYKWTFNKLIAWGVPESQSNLITMMVLFVLVAVLLGVIAFVLRKVLVNILTRVAAKSSTKFDDFLVENKVLLYVSRIIPLILFINFIPVIFSGFPGWIEPMRKIVDIMLVVGWVYIIRGVFRSVRDSMRLKKGFEDKPLDSYLQVANIFLFFIGGILIFSLLSGKSPWAFIGAFGALSAILMLVFKDTILGFVASIQVSTNDMVRVGDWIEMPKYGADGDVVEINLNTVKVQNWDKTITTIPTYYLITDSFKNWRGMHASGGRRIKRAIYIKISSIRFLEETEIEKLSKIQILAPYITERQAEIKKYNDETKADRTMPVNGRNMTNVGLFRQYINRMAKNHPAIRQDMTMLVRQLQPTEHGLPIELYMFVGDTRWAIYENVMSDIFDHLLSAIKYFGLEVFEAPASDDIRQLKFSA